MNERSLGASNAGSFPDFLFGDCDESLTGLDLNVEILFVVILGNILGEVVYFIILNQFSNLLEDKFHVFHVFVSVDNWKTKARNIEAKSNN